MTASLARTWLWKLQIGAEIEENLDFPERLDIKTVCSVKLLTDPCEDQPAVAVGARQQITLSLYSRLEVGSENPAL